MILALATDLDGAQFTNGDDVQNSQWTTRFTVRTLNTRFRHNLMVIQPIDYIGVWR